MSTGENLKGIWKHNTADSEGEAAQTLVCQLLEL